jgi:Pyruvate/2-oxoacid:ferredoxin oxidoreductase delta subunit
MGCRKNSFSTGCSKRSRYKAPETPRNEAYIGVRRNEEGRGQHRRWIFFSNLLNERRKKMTQEVYKKLIENLAKRGIGVMEIPEFYDILRELFTPEEAVVASTQPPGDQNRVTAGDIAKMMGWTEDEVSPILESMINKGTCAFSVTDGIRYYMAPSIGVIRNLQFMRGTSTERDKLLAKLFENYYKAQEAITGPVTHPLPVFRVISIEKTIPVENVVHTYDQVSYYIEKADPIAVSACYCRHQAKLADPEYNCQAPVETCMTFNRSAEYVIAANFGRKIAKKEAYEILDACEEAGLIHTGAYNQDINDICSCCTCHCGRIVIGMKQAKPIIAQYSGFQPTIDAGICISCQTDRTCLEQCPMKALNRDDNQSIVVDKDLCIGCGLCVRHCKNKAIMMEAKPEFPSPPPDWNAFVAEWIKETKKMKAQAETIP